MIGTSPFVLLFITSSSFSTDAQLKVAGNNFARAKTAHSSLRRIQLELNCIVAPMLNRTKQTDSCPCETKQNVSNL